MKALKKFLYMVTAVAAFLATGCTEQIEPEPAPELVGQQVYFDTNQSTAWVIGRSDDIKTEGGKSYVEIPVYRMVDAEAYTLEYRFEAEAGIDTPAAPKFAAGEKATKFVVYFDEAAFEPGVTKTFSIQLSQNLSEYGDTEYTFSISMPELWNSLGMGLYRDDFLLPLYGGPAGYMWQVEIRQHAVETHRIRVIEPFSPEIISSIFGGVPGDMQISELEGYIEFDVTNPENVLIVPSPCGFMLNPGIGSMVDFYLTNYDDENSTGKYSNGVITFAPGSLFWMIPDGRGNYTNASGLFAVAMPGVSLKDASISASYAGMYVSADGNTSSAIFEFVLGSDVEKYRFAVVPGNVSTDYAAVVEGIVNNTLEGVVESEASELKWEVALETGNYTLVAVPYAGGEPSVGDAFATYFYFPGAGGGEKPDAEINLMVDSLPNIMQNPAYEANYPSEYYMAIALFFEPSEISGMRFYVGDVDVVHAAVEAGEITYQELVDTYGNDVYSWVESYDQGNVRILPMQPGSKNCTIFAFDTIYGKTQYYHFDYEMPAYTGTFAIGAYQVTEGQYSQPFEFAPGDQPGSIFLTTPEGYQLIGAYDEDAKTVTFDGTFYGYENNGPLFGSGLFYYNDAQTQIFSYACSVDGSVDEAGDYLVANAPLVIELNADYAPSTNKSYFRGQYYDQADGLLHTVYEFTPAAVFTPAAATQSVSVDGVLANLYNGESSSLALTPSISYEARPFVGNIQREYVFKGTLR